ncbi:MAG TPA: hypothetical protein VN606_15310 [Thermoleophilaceae bacterium]|nr:hypothetical protein [Thermoleophilaceae bacterium]
MKSVPAKAWDGAGTVGRAAVGAVAGGAAIGLAGRAAVKRMRRPRVLGIPLPRMRKLDMKHVAKQIGNVAEQLETTGDDVRKVSAQAKKMSKALS